MYRYFIALAKRLPRPLRHVLSNWRRLYHSRRIVNLESIRPRKSFAGRHVVVAGLFGTTSGIGRAAELVALTLERDGHCVERVDLTDALGIPVRRPSALKLPSDCTAIDASDVVMVINPDRPNIFAPFDSEWLLRRCLIGHWIWEIETLPKHWAKASDAFDEIWAPTDLVLDVIRSDIPRFRGAMRVVPYAIDLDPTPPRNAVTRETVRRRLGFDDKTFVVGYSFSGSSNYYRKNPEAAVAAFTRAFPKSGPQPAALLLRALEINDFRAELKQLKRAIGSDDRVRLFGEATALSLSDFYAAIDVYISPSRAEGYGLNLVEAAQSGVDVITNGWRLAPEIAVLPRIRTVSHRLVGIDERQDHYGRIKAARWSEPDIEEMADLLIQLSVSTKPAA